MTKSEKIAQINAKLTADIAAVKVQKEQTIADYYAKVAELQRAACEAKNAATDDEQQEEQEQPVVWADGHQHTAVITARRILRKLPPIPYNCSVDIAINHYTKGMISLQVKGYNPNREGDAFTEVWLSGAESVEQQEEAVSGWFKETERLFAVKPSNDHVAEPIGNLLDNVFGGNPLDDFPTIRKEAENE